MKEAQLKSMFQNLLNGNSTSKYQVSLTDERKEVSHPKYYPRADKFFDNVADRDNFLKQLETEFKSKSCNIIRNTKMSHPYFESFDVVDKRGKRVCSITVYR